MMDASYKKPLQTCMRSHTERGSKTGVAGCGMGHIIEEGCGIQEILRAGYGIEISWLDRDTLISIGEMRYNFDNDGRLLDLNSK